MATRPIWTGQLRLSLVAIPVEVHPATRSGSKISFRQIHGPSGKPVQYQKTVAGIGPVDRDDILKGYETARGEYVLIDPEEVEAIRLETKKTLELVQFVDAGEIAPLWYDRPYYLVPTDALAEDAYRVVRDALRRTGRIGLGQLTMRGKEHLCAVKPCGDGLLLETLFYADELNRAAPYFAEIEDAPADEELLEVATALIDRKTAPFKAEAFRDRYAEALRDLVEAKVRNRKTPRARTGEAEAEPAAGRGNVVDLMEALKRSLSASGGKAGGRGKAKQKAPARAAPKKPAPRRRGAG